MTISHIEANIKSHLDAFCEFAKSANQSTFIEIYGERLGTHFWDKHTNFHNRNMTWTYNDMNNENREKMVEYISIQSYPMYGDNI